jgi:hypothetical protein
VIILGGILGITLMRYMASLFLRWLDEFSRLEDAAFAIIALVGSLMLLEVFFPQIELPEWGMVLAVLPLFVWGFSQRRSPSPPAVAQPDSTLPSSTEGIPAGLAALAEVESAAELD